MTSCSSASLIKLCVVFWINISWFTTGTAPPLSVLIRGQEIRDPTSVGEQEIRTTLSQTPISTTIDSFSDRNWAPTRTPILSPTASSHLHVTVADQTSGESKTFSSTKNPTSSSLSSSWKTKHGESLQGGESSSTYSTSSLSKKFEDLFSTRITSSLQSHPSEKMSYNKISQEEISDIIGASKTIKTHAGSGRRDLSLSTSTSTSTWSTTLFSTSYLSSPQGVDELSPTDLRSSSNFATDEDGNEVTQAHQESFTTPTPPEITLSSTQSSLEVINPRDEDFLSKISPSLKDGKTTQPQPPPPLQPGSPELTTTTDSEDQLEFQDDYYETMDEGGSLSIGILFDKDYSPEEIAQYIFLTGDETGVASTINDLINDGLMLSREETIKFLEAVKAHLTKLRIRYQEFLIENGIDDNDHNYNNGAETEEESSGGKTIIEILKNNQVTSSDNSSSESILPE